MKNQIVLVPTDFSPVADFAIDHAAGIAKQINGKMSLLHIINKDTKSLLKNEEPCKEAVINKLEEISKTISEKYNITIDSIAKEGSIFTTINEVSAQINASIIVMGTHGKVGLQHLIGSYALKVIESSNVPVIVVQEKKFGHGYKDIVLPIDETPESKQKVKWAIHIAKMFDSTIHLFGAYFSDELLMNDVERNMAQIKNILAKNDIRYTEKISSDKGGNYAKGIALYADYIKADMVLIMTNPDQLLPSFILSPWAEHVIFNSSKTPVLCVNPVDLDIQYVSF
jgi:nucleotide-binding universal stress UspA family protein